MKLLLIALLWGTWILGQVILHLKSKYLQESTELALYSFSFMACGLITIYLLVF